MDQTVKVWSIYGNGQPLKTLTGHQDIVNSVNFNANSKVITSSSSDGTIRFWDVDGRELATFRDSQEILDARFSPDGKMLAYGGANGVMKLLAWNLDELMKLACDRAHDYLANTSDESVNDSDRAICGISPRN